MSKDQASLTDLCKLERLVVDAIGQIVLDRQVKPVGILLIERAD